MSTKLTTVLIVITSLFGYLEWSGGNATFLFQAEADIIVKLFTNPLSLSHPFIILPLIGQITLIYTLFQPQPSKILIIAGTLMIGLLLLFMLFVGLYSSNLKITLSVLPFILISTYVMIKMITSKKHNQVR